MNAAQKEFLKKLKLKKDFRKKFIEARDNGDQEELKKLTEEGKKKEWLEEKFFAFGSVIHWCD